MNEQKSCCEVCFQSNDKYYPDSDERGIKMMVCYGCSIKCHSYCYGVDTQTQEECFKNKQDQKILYFLCQKCRIEPKKQIACAVCNTKKGALKKIENSTTNEWVHITCGFYNGGIIKVDNYRAMSFVKQSPNPIEKDKKAKKNCHFCKSDVGIRKCFAEGCQQHAHIYCTMRYMQEQEIKEVDANDMEWFVRLNYVNNPNFDISKGESETNDLSKNVYFQEQIKHNLNEVSQILIGTPIYEVQNPAASFTLQSDLISSELKQSKLGSSRKGRGKRKLSEDNTQIQDQNMDNPSAAQEEIGKEINPDSEITKQNKIKYQSKLVEIGHRLMQNFVVNLSNNIYQEDVKTPTQSVKKGTKQQHHSDMKGEENDKESYNSEIALRGGEIALECPEHRRQDVYCVCQKVDAAEDMVFCDLCSDWYHYNCVKFDKKKQDANDDRYRCPMCDEWYNHKKKKLLKEFYSGKVEGYDILISNMPKFNLMDFISVVLITDQRIQNVLFQQKKGNIDVQINDAIKNLCFIPLFSSKISEITVFKQRKYLHQAVNDFLQKIIEETELLKLVSAIQIDENNQFKYIIIEENFKKNEELKRLIDEISALYQKNKMKEKGILFNLKKPINWIMKSHQTFFRKQEKISPLILNDLIKEDEEEIISTVEYKFFDQILQKFKSWNTKVLSLYENICQRAQSKMEEEKGNSTTEKQEIDEEEFINLKYKLWRERLVTRPTIQELESILEEGRDIPVDCSQEIKKLELEKEEVQIWCQTLEVQERNASSIVSQKLKQEERVNKTQQSNQSDLLNFESDKHSKKEISSSKIIEEQPSQQDEIKQEKPQGIEIEEQQNQEASNEKQNENQESQQEIVNEQTVQGEQNQENIQNDKDQNQAKLQEDQEMQLEKVNEEQPKQTENAMDIESNITEKDDKKENEAKSEQENTNEGVKNYLDSEMNQKIYKNQQLMSKGDFEIFAHKMFTKVVLQVPRMNTVIDMMEQYDRNELQWERLLEFINEKEQESIQKQQEPQEEQQQQINVQNQLQNNLNKFELIEQSELKDLLESSLKLEIKVPFLNQIAQQINNYMDIKAQFQAILNSEFDENTYSQNIKRFSTLPFVFEEEKIFQERMSFYKEIQEICKNDLKKFYTVDHLQKLIEIAQQSKYPESILTELKSKIDPALQIVQGIHKIQEIGQIEKDQLELLKEYSAQMKNYKVDFRREMEFIKNVDKSEKWFRSLHKFFFNLTPEQIQLDPSQRVQEIDLELEEVLEAKDIQECLNDIQEKWNLVADNTSSVKNELIGFVKEGSTIESHPDKRIQKIFSNLSELFWINEANILLSNPNLQEIKVEQVYPVYQYAINFRISQDNETFKKIKVLVEESSKRKIEEIELINKYNEQMKQRQLQQQQEALQLQQLEMEKLKQQSLPLEKKKINLIVSDSENENDSNTYSSDYDSGIDDEEDEDEDGNDELDEEDDEDVEIIDEKKQTPKEGLSKKQQQNKTQLIQIESDISVMDEEESSIELETDEDLDNLNESQQVTYKQLIEQGKKWNIEIQQIHKAIQDAQNINKQSENTMEVEVDSYLVTFQQLKNLLQEGYSIIFDILQLKKSVLFMKSSMIKLENIFANIHKRLVEFNKIKDPDQLPDSIKIQKCIDVSDILIEYKVNLGSDSQEKLSFKYMIKSPFKNLHKFAQTYNKQEDLEYFIKEYIKEIQSKTLPLKQNKVTQQQLKQKQQQQKQNQKSKPKSGKQQSSVIELESQDNNSENNNDSKSEKSNQQSGLRQRSKRKKTKPIDSDFVYGIDFVKSLNKEEQLDSKLKQKGKQGKDQPSADGKSNIQQQQHHEVESQEEDDDEYDSANLEHKNKPDIVNDGDRNQIKESLKKVIMQNQVFVKFNQNPVKTIENQIFGEFYKTRKRYLEKSEQYIKLFTTLISYPLISKKILAKNFSIVTLDRLINSANFENLENTLRQQMPQQAPQQQPQQQQRQQAPIQPQQPQTPQNQLSTQNIQSSQNALVNNSLQKTMNSSKEPQIQKKIKPFDPLAKLPGLSSSVNPPSQQNQPVNSSSALSMLIQKNDPNKQNNKDMSMRQNSNSSNNNNNVNNNSNNNNNMNQFQNKYKDDYQNKRNQYGNNKYYQQTNNRKRRNQQATFSDESDNDDQYDKNDMQQDSQKETYYSDSFKSRNPKYEDSFSSRDDIKLKQKSHDSDQKKSDKDSKQLSPSQQQYFFTNEDNKTPKSSINKQDYEAIEQIQNAYTSESKIYTFEKSGGVSQNTQGSELLYNPDEEEDGQGIEEEENIQLINQQYFDKDDEIQIGMSSTAENQNSTSNSNFFQKVNSQTEGDMESLYQQNLNSQKDIKDKRESQISKDGDSIEVEEEADEPIPDDSIIRICKCRVKPIKNFPSVNASMYTVEQIRILKKFPLIDTSKSFDLFSYTDLNQVKSYIGKSLKNKSITILKGWIEIQNPKQDSERLLQAIQLQDQKDKVAGFKISGMTFNIFTEAQFNKTEHKFNMKHFNQDNYAVLPFIIYKKTNEPKPASINPFKIVKFCPNPIPPQNLSDPKKYSNQQVVSPILSDNEDDEIFAKRDSIFDDKFNESSQQDSQPNISLKGLQDIDFTSLQQQLLELPTTNEVQQGFEDKQELNQQNQGQMRHFQQIPSGPQQGYNIQGGQYNNYSRQQQPPIPIANQPGFPNAMHLPPPPPPPPHIPFHSSNQNFSNNPNFNMNQGNLQTPLTPSHMIMGVVPHQQHHGVHMNFNQQQPPINPSIPPPPLSHQTSSQQNIPQAGDKQDSDKKQLGENLEHNNEGAISNPNQMVNEDAQNENFDIDLQDVDFDQLAQILEQTEQEGPGSAHNSNRPSLTSIPPAQPGAPQQQHQIGGSNQYLNYGQIQKQPPLPHHLQVNQNMYTPPPPPPQNIQGGDSGQTQNQNPNIDNNLQQLLISQRSKPMYETNPQNVPPFPNQQLPQQQPPQQPQQIQNFQNKNYPHQQQPNVMAPPPPPPQIANQSQIPPPPPTHPSQFHGHQGGPNQGQQWNQNPVQGNPQYHRNPQNKNQQYGMNNQNNAQYQKGMVNAPPPPIPPHGQIPGQQQQNMPPQGYNRGYPHNQQHNQNSNQNNNNMNRQQRYQPNNQGYGGQQFNSNSPNSQNQQNYNKFQRGNPNQNNNNSSGGSNNSSSNNNNNNNNNNSNNNKAHQQFKNHFGSRQQAHYQRNNQPYTAHNPVPFIEPAEQQLLQNSQQQMQQHQQMQHHQQPDNMQGHLDERDYS